MVSKIEHNQRTSCPIACGLDVIGDHWSLLIVRDMLYLGRHEFSEFVSGEEGISTNILSDRLQKLKAQGIIDEVTHPHSKRRKLYFLTPKGRDLIHVLMAIGEWSLIHMPENAKMADKIESLLGGTKEEFVANVLRELDEWEAQYVIGAAPREAAHSAL
ncbi:winged helix-turn-helix transcriptional regulator [Aurantivibrio plasticivorans]